MMIAPTGDNELAVGGGGDALVAGQVPPRPLHLARHAPRQVAVELHRRDAGAHHLGA
jgi:hypothetical protein